MIKSFKWKTLVREIIRRRFLIGSVFVLGFCLIIGIRIVFSDRIERWKKGITEFSSLNTPLKGYLHDMCSKDPGPNCTCVAFIHGTGQNALIWKKLLFASPEEWRHQGVEDPLKILAVDLPGASVASKLPQKNLQELRKQAEMLRTGLSGLCPRWVLVGQESGGWIAAWLALDWPEGVKRLILMAGLQGELQMGLIQVPTLLLWGKDDAVVPITTGYQIRESMHSAIWREATGGHFLQNENPDAVMQSIRDMLNFGSM